MFYSTLTSETSTRFGRHHWTWRFSVTKICTRCKKHVVTAGADACPTCGHPVAYVGKMPRKGRKNRFRKLRDFYNPSRSYDSGMTYPTATPRRLPGNREI